MFQIYKEVKKRDTKKKNNPIFKKRCTDLNRELSKNETQMVETLEEMFAILSQQGNATLRCHLTPVRTAKINKTDDSLRW